MGAESLIPGRSTYQLRPPSQRFLLGESEINFDFFEVTLILGFPIKLLHYFFLQHFPEIYQKLISDSLHFLRQTTPKIFSKFNENLAQYFCVMW